MNNSRDTDDVAGPHEFASPHLLARMHAEEIERANAAVLEALRDFEKQTWSQTAAAKARHYAFYWLSYKPRELVALAYVRLLCWLTKEDSRLVSQRAWRMLGL